MLLPLPCLDIWNIASTLSVVCTIQAMMYCITISALSRWPFNDTSRQPTTDSTTDYCTRPRTTDLTKIGTTQVFTNWHRIIICHNTSVIMSRDRTDPKHSTRSVLSRWCVYQPTNCIYLLKALQRHVASADDWLTDWLTPRPENWESHYFVVVDNSTYANPGAYWYVGYCNFTVLLAGYL